MNPVVYMENLSALSTHEIFMIMEGVCWHDLIFPSANVV